MDPIADMLTRIRNAYRANHASVLVPASRIKADIARVLEEKGFIDKVEKRGKKVRKFLDIKLCYDNGRPCLSSIRRISSPSRRIYRACRELRRVRQGTGIVILSTSAGIMSDDEARKLGVGGEVICELW